MQIAIIEDAISVATMRDGNTFLIYDYGLLIRKKRFILSIQMVRRIIIALSMGKQPFCTLTQPVMWVIKRSQAVGLIRKTRVSPITIRVPLSFLLMVLQGIMLVKMAEDVRFSS